MGGHLAGIPGEAALGGGRRGVRQGPVPKADAVARGDGRQPPHKDSNLRTVPVVRAGRRGRRRVYGEGRIDLAKRGGQSCGWATGTFTLYGKPAVKRYKTFVATWRPAGGAIRVVLVDEPGGWVAFFCSDPTAGVADILGNVAGRFSLEITFQDVKEIIGAGQQRVRSVAGNVGAFHL